MLLKSLTYTSRDNLAMSERNAGDIHLASWNLSALDGITGVLIFDGVSFFQIIVGVEDAVDSLAKRLLHDDRHVDVQGDDKTGHGSASLLLSAAEYNQAVS